MAGAFALRALCPAILLPVVQAAAGSQPACLSSSACELPVSSEEGALHLLQAHSAPQLRLPVSAANASSKALLELARTLGWTQQVIASGSDPWDNVHECVIQSAGDCRLSHFDYNVLYKVLPGGETACLNGARHYFFQVVKRDTQNLLLIFQSGGVCYSKEAYDRSLCDTDPNMQMLDGLLDGTQADNPYNQYSIVVVTSCSGDLHSGHAEQPWGTAGAHVKQRGYENTQAVLQWTANQFPELTSLTVLGISTGAYALQWWASYILDTLTQSRTHAVVCADSFIGVTYPTSDSRAVDAYLMELWKMCGTHVIKHRGMRHRCSHGRLTFSDVWKHAMRRHRRATFAHINSKSDLTQVHYANAVAAVVGNTATMTKQQYYFAVNKRLEDWGRNRNYRSYLVDGEQHNYLDRRYAYTATPHGKQGSADDRPTLLDWTRDLLSRRRQTPRHVCKGTRMRVGRRISTSSSVVYCDKKLYCSRNWRYWGKAGKKGKKKLAPKPCGDDCDGGN